MPPREKVYPWPPLTHPSCWLDKRPILSGFLHQNNNKKMNRRELNIEVAVVGRGNTYAKKRKLYRKKRLYPFFYFLKNERFEILIRYYLGLRKGIKSVPKVNLLLVFLYETLYSFWMLGHCIDIICQRGKKSNIMLNVTYRV